MLEFLRLLTPRHADALRPASPVRRAASILPDVMGNRWDAGSDVAAHAAPMHGDEPPPATSQPQSVEPTPERGQPQALMDPSRPVLARSTTLVATPASPHARLPPHPAQLVEPVEVPRPASLPASPVLARRIDATGSMPSTVASSTNAPLSPASVALLAAAPAHASAPPALHINIDRIEVRAPAPAPKHAATRSRAAPATQSLSDYLGGRGRTTP